nr:MAG TPA: hypothetical protein [Caudoviricetes sp.]
MMNSKVAKTEPIAKWHKTKKVYVRINCIV